MEQLPVILDTDPGIDDAVALIVLHRFCKERVAFLVTTYGNVSLSQTTNNALTMCSLLNWDVDVIAGAQNPCGGNTAETAKHIHGEDGLGGLGLSCPKKAAIKGDYLQIIHDRILLLGKTDYITIGPLTNLAALLKRYPDTASHLSSVTVMGGGINKGNVTPDAEFNIYSDPFSAQFVFSTLPNVAMTPLNVTETVAFSLSDIQKIAKKGTALSLAMGKILTANYHSCVRFGEKGSTMHDATAVLYYLHPEWFAVKQCGIDVDCREKPGKTTVDFSRDNVTLLVETDPDRILQTIAEGIEESD